jgi:hypothetical protein
LVASGKDRDEPPSWFGRELITRVFSSLEGFILSQKIVRKKFRIEEEYEPTLAHDPDAVRIGISLSVLHDGDDFDALHDFFYSEGFEAFFQRELREIVASLLRPKAPWFSAKDCEVEIDGIGEG